MEVWKFIERTNKNYEISNKGRVRSWKGNNQNCPKRSVPVLMNPFVNNGYYKAKISFNEGRKLSYIHRLVAKAFIPNPENKPQVNHIDGNKLNNYTINLEWCMHKENHRHAVEMGLMERGEDRYNSKLTENDIIKIRDVYDVDGSISQRDLAKEYNVSQRLIWNIVNNKVWVHV